MPQELLKDFQWVCRPAWYSLEAVQHQLSTFLGEAWNGPAAEQKQNKTKDSPPGPPPGEEVVWTPSPDEQFPPSPGHPSQGLLHLRLPPGLAGAGRAWRPACDRLHNAAWWKSAAAAWERGQPEGGATGDEQAEGLQPEWKQQASSGAWCVWSSQSASVLPKTAGHSSRQRRQRGWSVTREHSGTVPSPAPSCQWNTTRGGAPGPQAWTSHDPETVRSQARGPSQHAANVEPPGRDHPRAGLSLLWPDGPAVTPCCVGLKPPPHRLYKHCQIGLTNTYRSVRGDTVHPTEWKRLLDIVAWPQIAPQRGCPCTPKRLHHQGWWGGRSHKIFFGQWKVPATIL